MTLLAFDGHTNNTVQVIIPAYDQTVHAREVCMERTAHSVVLPVRVVYLANLTWRADR